MVGPLSVAELSAHASAIEANSDPAAARSEALALEAQLEPQLAIDTAAWQKARDAFGDRHFGYSRYWGSSLREKARDVTPLEDKVVADQTTLQRLAKVVVRTTRRIDGASMRAAAEQPAVKAISSRQELLAKQLGAEAIYVTLDHFRVGFDGDALIASAVAAKGGTPAQAKAVQSALHDVSGLRNIDGGLIGAAAVRAGVSPQSAIAMYKRLTDTHAMMYRSDAATLVYASLVSGKPMDEVLAAREVTGSSMRAAQWALGPDADMTAIAAHRGMIDPFAIF